MDLTDISKLSKFIDTHVPIINAELSSVSKEHFNDKRQILSDAIHYSVTGGGKRIRPLLTIATYSLFEEEITPILPLAIAIELVHTYSLIHDDLPAMDNDDLRRGRATVHKKFGEDIAILAGDALNTFAFEYLSQNLPIHFSPTASLLVIQKLGHALGINGMAGGQLLDITSHENNKDASLRNTIHALKTGAVIKACFELPGICLSVPEHHHIVLNNLGEKFGMLFQIIDDILDHTGSTEELGKSAGKDKEQEKLTYVSHYGITKAKSLAKLLKDQINESLESSKLNNTSLLSEFAELLFERTM